MTDRGPTPHRNWHTGGVVQPEMSPSWLAQQARERFVRHVCTGLPQVADRVREYLLRRSDEVLFGEEAQRLRDAYLRFQTSGARWCEIGTQRLNRSLQPHEDVPSTGDVPDALSLVGEEAVESQILAARAALVVVDKASEVFNELRLRLQHLELRDELDKRDPVQALQVCQTLVDAWTEAGLLRLDWQVGQSALQGTIAKLVAGGYEQANQWLRSQDVLPEIDLRALLRRTSRSGDAVAPAQAAAGQVTHVMPWRPTSGRSAGEGDLPGVGIPPIQALAAQVSGQGLEWLAPPNGHQAVAQRLMAFIGQRLPGVDRWAQPATAVVPATAGMSRAGGEWTGWAAAGLPPVDWSSLEAGMAGLREQSRALKRAADSDEDKALIELVALIFDAILSEDRIPPSIRLWFARLQMPVLRTALADPSFLTADDHPARRLIDRMGSCVLGFDPGVGLDALEAEIKRIVQVVEQYPETGRRVFELVLKEFEDFLARAVHEQPQWQSVVDVASQLEQRETLTVRYTIELRKLLEKASVLDGLRDFLFHTWAEVMAQAAVVYGEKDERAVKVRELAADLLWAASTKPTRHERAQVIARVPGLMARLRDGLNLLGLDPARQEAALKPVNDALAAAFVSRAASVDPAWLARFTRQLETLEEVLPSAQDTGETVLSRESLELLTGQETGGMAVVPDPDTPVPKHLLSWASALHVGSWFTLEHNGRQAVVRLAWVSPRKQLYLFVNAVQQAWLIQQGRVAMYLKAGLLRPGEAEALTTRATRQALVKLEANPERLLQAD